MIRDLINIYTVLSCSVVSDSLRPHGLLPTRLLCPWGFSRQEYWSGLPCPPPGDLPNPGIEPRSPTLQVDSLSSEPQHIHYYRIKIKTCALRGYMDTFTCTRATTQRSHCTLAIGTNALSFCTRFRLNNKT